MLLVDGYNLLFALKRPDRRTLERDRDELVRAIESHCARTNQRACVFFDRGGPRRVTGARVDVIYVEEGGTADARIVAALESTPDRTAYRVISSDGEIRREAERRRVPVTPVMAFWREVADSGRPVESGREAGASEGEAEYWMRELGLGSVDDETGKRP